MAGGRRKAKPAGAVKTIAGIANRQPVTPAMYEAAWRLVSTGATIPQVLSAVGCTRQQLVWMIREGNDELPSFSQRTLEHLATLRQRASEAGAELSAAGVEGIKRELAISSLAQRLILVILSDVATALTRNREVMEGKAPGTPVSMASIVPPAHVTSFIKAIGPLASMTGVAEAFTAIYSGALGMEDPFSVLPRETRDELTVESTVPASITVMAETRTGPVSTDPITELIPELGSEWTTEEIIAFAETGVRPARDFQQRST